MRVLIVDDDPGIASALARGAQLHGLVPSTFNRADHALEALLSGQFEAAIVDVMLGEDSGIDVVKRAREHGIALPIIMLSALSEVEHRAAGLEAGADDYVVKPFDFNELLTRLKVQAHRAEARRPQLPRFDPQRATLTCGEEAVSLTDREAALLCLLIEAQGAPLSRGEIFDRLWASEGSGSENVVDVYIGYLRKKIGTERFGFGIKTQRNRGFAIDGLLPRLGEG